MEKQTENEMEKGVEGLGFSLQRGLYRGYIGIMGKNTETTNYYLGFRFSVREVRIEGSKLSRTCCIEPKP